MENQHQAVDVDLDRGERENAAQFYRLDRQTWTASGVGVTQLSPLAPMDRWLGRIRP